MQAMQDAIVGTGVVALRNHRLQAADIEYEYVGFWARVGAAIIDTLLILMVATPLMLAFYGEAYSTSTDLVLGLLIFS